MFTYNERDLHRMPTPARSHLPIKTFIAESQILDEDSARDNEADVALLRLPAPSLRGTFQKAYALLTKLVILVGWDELLKCRSQVFVMEEEYRQQRSISESTGGHGPAGKHRSPRLDAEDGGEGSESGSNRDFSSRRNSQRVDSANGPTSPIPIITVSTSEEQTQNEDQEEEEAQVASEQIGPLEKINGQSVPQSPMARDAPGVDRPMATHTLPGTESKNEPLGLGITTTESPEANVAPVKNTFLNKRLCERWLDNLFMVLYEVSLEWNDKITSKTKLKVL